MDHLLQILNHTGTVATDIDNIIVTKILTCMHIILVLLLVREVFIKLSIIDTNLTMFVPTCVHVFFYESPNDEMSMNMHRVSILLDVLTIAARAEHRGLVLTQYI